jgi:replicative DNA helicase
MPEAEVADRVVSSMSQVTYSRILRHDLADDDWGRVQVAVDKLAGIPLRIVDKPYLTLAAIRSLARAEAKTTQGLSLLVVDYIQLIAPADARAPREQQVAAMSRGLKLLAKELKVPVVALAQLNRAGASRSDKTPTLTDLRESGQLEADADHVLLLHLPDVDTRMGELDVYVAKNRGGPTCCTTLLWAPHYQAIRGYARGEAPGWPS